MLLRSLLPFVLVGALVGCGGGGDDDDGGGTITGACGLNGALPGGTPVAVNLSGTVTYDMVGHTAGGAINYGAITARPVRGATVELHATNGALLLPATQTDANGDYALAGNVPPGDAVICVYSELVQANVGANPSWEFLVVDNTNGKALYALESATVSVAGALTSTVDVHAASGWGGSSYTGTRSAGPFAILDATYAALQKILSVDADVDLPRLRLNWSVNNTNTSGNTATGNIGTSFFNVENGSNEIYILGDDDNDTDEYDDHVVAHEFGHYMEQVLSRADSIGGSHGGDDRLDMRVAYGEGFGNAWSGIVFDNPLYQDSFGNDQNSGFTIDVENDTSATEGWFNETSVQSIIYDVYDATNEAGDTVALGLQPLYDVWTGAQRTTPALTSIFPFLKALRDANPGSAAAITTLATAQTIAGTDEWGTGETNSGGSGTDVLPVYVDHTPGPAAVATCSTNAHGTYNALGNYRWFRFTHGGGNRTFTVTAPAPGDFDAVLFQAGNQVGSVQDDVGADSWTENLAAGTYVLQVYEYQNFDGLAGRRTCGSVTIN